MENSKENNLNINGTNTKQEGHTRNRVNATGTSLTRFLACMAPVIVSLPGAEPIASDELTILQVINQINVTPTATATTNHTDELKVIDEPNNNNNNKTNVDLVDQPQEQQQQQEQQNTKAKKIADQPLEQVKTPVESAGRVLDIESHLIENLDSSSDDLSSVGIKELLPKQDELSQGTSKTETELNVHSVIEVEPIGAKTKQPVETCIAGGQPDVASITSTSNQASGNKEVAAESKVNQPESEAEPEPLLATAQQQQSVAEEEKEEEEKAELADEPPTISETEAKAATNNNQANEVIKAAAESFVKELEQQAIEQVQQRLNEEEQDSAAAAIANDLGDTQANHINEGTAAAVSLINDTQQSGSEERKLEPELAPEQSIDQIEQKTDNSKTCNEAEQQAKDETPIVVPTELTSILKTSKSSDSTSPADKSPLIANSSELKVIQIPTSNTPLEEEERKLFFDSLPHIKTETDATKLQADCKREYYQSLKKYLIESSLEKPPVPLQTYRWEDLKRAKDRGGYPWTHLYKRPLGPDEEPEIILLLRKSQELRFTSESPKSLKRVRYDEQVLVKETDRYIQELSDTEEEETPNSVPTDEESQSIHSETISCVSDSCLAAKHPKKRNRLSTIKAILKRKRSGRNPGDTQSLPSTSVNTSVLDIKEETENSELAPTAQPSNPEQKSTRCQTIMKKLKSMADRQKKRLNIKRITLKKDEKINLVEETKILKLKNSPKAERSEIPHFIEKQDSDDVLEIVELDESPSRKRNDAEANEQAEETTAGAAAANSIVAPDEIIDLETKPSDGPETAMQDETADEEPKRTPRLRREHVYEEIEQAEPVPSAALTGILEAGSVEALKKSLLRQDNCALEDIEAANKTIPLDRMGSSEEEQIVAEPTKSAANLLAPISSIDSASSDEDRNRPQLSPVAEESDVASQDGQPAAEIIAEPQLDLKPTIKKEPSPAPSDKKVTFSHVEDEAEPHREDIELPDSVLEAAAANSKWKNMRDHDYEPIADPADANAEVQRAALQREASPMSTSQRDAVLAERQKDLETLSDEIKEAAELQKELEDRYFTLSPTAEPDAAAATEGALSNAAEAEEMDDQAIKAEKKGFMATAQDHTRRMQTGIRNQATKIRTRLRPTAKKPTTGSPTAKKKERFKTPQFSKLKMPDIKRPDMSKLKDFKRPEFTKFSKPDMTKFKLPEKLTTLKLKRSRSFKQEESNDNELSTHSPDSQPATDGQPHKKTFEFNFGTYPRAFRKKKKPVEPESPIGTEGASVNPSSTTQPSFESSSSPQGDRGPGPVRSRWADKFSDVSYNDSEGSRYRRYGSELESFDKESSLERRMKDDLEESASASEIQDLGILGGVAETKQFAEFDEENRAIHEISNLRSGEFRRRPMVHQDSDLRSEDSKEAVGWTDKEIQRNKLLRKAEMEAEASYLKYGEEGIAQETQSTASSTGRKVVMEEIDDDEFFLRKRGISEDNIELRQYISSAIRGGYDMPINALEHVGQNSEPPMEFGDYDVPPPKPRRLHKGYRPQDESQEFDMQRSDYGDDFSVSQNGSDFFVAPKKPMRKDRSRSKYSMDSENPALTDDLNSHEQYFDNDEEYLRPPNYDNESELGMNDLSFTRKELDNEVGDASYPQPPRRQKRRARDGSLEKDSLINGFGGKSVSNSYLQQPKDVIVYRTEHEYHVPIATPETYTDDASTSTHKSMAASRYDDDDELISRGAQSFEMEANVRADYNADSRSNDDQDKFIIDMMENDGYAIVRKEHVPKPTPPARRKRFARSPGERFATLPNMRSKRGTPPPERPPPPRAYTPSVDQPIPPIRKSSHSLDMPQTFEDDYEEPETSERPESPRNLQSGEVINKMKYRPLPAPPRPPREKRQRGESRTSMQTNDDESAVEYADSEDTAEHLERTNESEIDDRLEEVEAATQTDPLPDSFEVAEFEITDSMRIIEPRRRAKTLDELLQEDTEDTQLKSSPGTEDEQLARGLQRFREANQRSLSERSRASSQADRSKSLSRPPTPSAVVIESRVSTPSPYKQNEVMLEASLLVKPIDDLDLEEAQLRREGLLSDSSQQSKSDIESHYREYETDARKLHIDEISNAPSSATAESEQRLRSDDEQEKNETATSDLEAELEERYAQLMKELNIESDQGYLKQYDDEEAEAEAETEADTEAEERSRDEAQTELQASSEVDTATQESADEKPVQEEPIEKTTIQSTHHQYESIVATKPEETEPIKEPSPPLEYPQPPPRKKSATIIEPPTAALAIAEQPADTTSLIAATPAAAQLPTTVGDLAVERLHVHALQAGQIMVSQLHGGQISSDQLECNSANLVVNNIQLPPGFIEDIVERVRSSDRPTTLLTVETQTSLAASSEEMLNEQIGSPVPPKKPARQKQIETTAEQTSSFIDNEQQQQVRNPDEQTQTDPVDPMLTALPPLFPTVEYMQSLAPLAFYNMRRTAEDNAAKTDKVERSESMHRRRRPHRRHSSSSSSGNDETTEGLLTVDKPHTHRRRTRSSTQPPLETPTVAQAASQFLSACSLSLVNIINQLTDYIRTGNNKQQEVATRSRQVPTLVTLFVVITFALLLFLLSGKNVHTHHWDFFNPPGNEGRK